MKKRSLFSACLSCAIFGTAALAQDAGSLIAEPTHQKPAVTPESLQPLSGEASTEPTTQPLLGEKFESKSYGVALRPPADLELQDKQEGNSDVIADFTGKGAALKVTRLIPGTAVKLIGKRAPDGTFDGAPGLCDLLIEQMQQSTPGAKLKREDIITVGDPSGTASAYDCGVVVMRFALGTQRWLRQQAYFQASPHRFYVINYTVPTSTTDDANPDPNEAVAAAKFDAMINSIEVLDLSQIRAEQDLRLISTRALFVIWTPDFLKKALIGEQWNRILKDGKDVGYSYVVHEAAKNGLVDGIRVSVRTRKMDAENGGQQVDIGSQSFVSLDRRTESWEQVVTVRDNTAAGGDKQDIQMGAVFGTSLHQFGNFTDIEHEKDQKEAVRQPLLTEKISVDVTHIGKTGDAKPLKRDAALWYVPNALQELMPWIVPLDRPKGYMFQSYVPEARELMNRYVDVDVLQTVTFNGQKILAVPVSDRLGFEGKPNIYYMSPEGKFLGAAIPSQHIAIVPCDKDTLLGIWKNANLTRPEPMKRPDVSSGQ